MKNILLTYGETENKEEWMNYFDKYYYVKNNNKSIDHKEIKLFFKEKLVTTNGEDNLFVISNDLHINSDNLEKILNYITLSILPKDVFCYLWNYMQECQKLKVAIKYGKYNFYATNSANEMYAIAANFKTWYSILLDRDKSVPLYLRLQDKIDNNVYFVRPSLFDMPLEKIDNNYLLTSLCKENFNAQPLQPYNNNVAKIFFILTISIVSLFFYLFLKKIPRPRYFHLKHTS